MTHPPRIAVPRELLEAIPLSLLLQNGYNQTATKISTLLAAKPTAEKESEVVDVVGWRHSATGSCTEDAVRASTWIDECIYPLMTVAQHERITGKLRARIAELEGK